MVNILTVNLDDALKSDVEAELDSRVEDSDVDIANQAQVNQVLTGKNETVWQDLAISQVQRGRLQQQNILSFKPGANAFTTSRIIERSPLSSFRVLFDEAMVRNIRNITVTEAHHVSSRMNWDVTLDELDKFIGLIIAREILGKKGLPVESLLDTTWECPMFNKTLLRSRFKDKMRFYVST